MKENPYEKAVKWIEKEVYKNGVFSMSADDCYVDVGKIYTYSAHRTGNYSGFTVSSQHVKNEGNFLQLINKMMRKSELNKVENERGEKNG